MVLPIQIGVIALVVGGFLVYLAVKGPAENNPSAVKTVATKPLVSKSGGFRLGVPEGVNAVQVGKTVKLSTQDKSLVVTAGSIGERSLAAGSKAFVNSLKATYTEVVVLGTDNRVVDGRVALATFGQAVNAKKVKVRFVNLVVTARPRNYVINSFTAFGSDPRVILPKVNAIVSTFKVLGQP